MKWQIFRFEVSAEQTVQRLDQVLSEAVVDLSRSKAKKLIDIGGVHINGRRVRNCSVTLCQGDKVEVYQDQLPLEPYRISAVDIIYQDKYIIVLNKPALIETQPTHARYKGTIYEALNWYLRDDFKRHQKPAIGMVQRLDRGTSGVMVFSLHQHSHKAMTAIMAGHEIGKHYLAFVRHAPKSAQGEICSSLARSRNNNKVQSVDKGGKDAITRYRTLWSNGDIALLAIQILTGRSHQIRAHMSEQGCPLLGDVLYGGPKNYAGTTFARPLLHAFRLEFKHPVSAEPLQFKCPLPTDMQVFSEQLGVSCDDLSSD